MTSSKDGPSGLPPQGGSEEDFLFFISQAAILGSKKNKTRGKKGSDIDPILVPWAAQASPKRGKRVSILVDPSSPRSTTSSQSTHSVATVVEGEPVLATVVGQAWMEPFMGAFVYTKANNRGF